ncbi:trypsin-like peptidase domain-containing protein [Streptomyces mirabilis]|uniref:trypsin-like peptidase domain-containing protein n=1 Tax=Streptomyces mirabilis TaxID=68239 RepID=UPI00366A54A8
MGQGIVLSWPRKRGSGPGRLEARLSTGTGFIVRQGVGPGRGVGARRFLVTNRHVVDPNYEKPRGWPLTELRVSGHFQDPRHRAAGASRQGARLMNPAVYFPSKWDSDLAVVPLDDGEDVEGQGLFNSLPSGILALRHGSLDGEVTVGQQVLMPGYPGIEGHAAERPILVGGVIASDPRYPAATGRDVYEDQVLCHAFSWQGMARPPVLCRVPRPTTWNDLETTGIKDRTLLAGVNAGHIVVRDDATAGAIVRFVRANALADLLRQAGLEIFELPTQG